MNNLQHVVKDSSRFAMHVAVELCEQGDFDSVADAYKWLIKERGGPALGSGTCDWELVKSGPLYLVFRCSACGYEHSESMTDAHATDFDPEFCPKCGAKIRKAASA